MGREEGDSAAPAPWISLLCCGASSRSCSLQQRCSTRGSCRFLLPLGHTRCAGGPAEALATPSRDGEILSLTRNLSREWGRGGARLSALQAPTRSNQ